MYERCAATSRISRMSAFLSRETLVDMGGTGSVPGLNYPHCYLRKRKPRRSCLACWEPRGWKSDNQRQLLKERLPKSPASCRCVHGTGCKPCLLICSSLLPNKQHDPMSPPRSLSPNRLRRGNGSPLTI